MWLSVETHENIRKNESKKVTFTWWKAYEAIYNCYLELSFARLASRNTLKENC